MTRLEIGFITEADYEADEHEEHAIIRSSGAGTYSFLYSIPHSEGGTYIKTAEYNKEQLMVWFRGTMRMAMIALNPYKAFEFKMPIVPEFVIPSDKLAKEDELYSLVDLFSHQLDFLNVEGPAPIVVPVVVPAVVPVVQEDPSSSSSSSSSSSQDDPAVPIVPVESPSVPVESAPVESVPEASVPVESAPEASVPVESAPEASVPVESAPVASVPEASAPVASVPEASVPVESAPEASVPVESVPVVTSVPVESAPVESVSEARPSVQEARRSLRIKSKRPIVEGDD